MQMLCRDVVVHSGAALKRFKVRAVRLFSRDRIGAAGWSYIYRATLLNNVNRMHLT
jgi:hypothetical protein